MEIRDKIYQIIRERESGKISTNKAKDSILHLFDIEPNIILTLQWEKDSDSKTGWSTWGWEDENGNLFEGEGYELEEVLEEDKYGHVTKARFRYVG